MTQSAHQAELDWSPRDISGTRLARFIEFASQQAGRDLSAYADLWRWSVEDLDGFWGAIWDFFGLEARDPAAPVLADERMPGAIWFPTAALNYTAEIFKNREPEAIAVVAVDESLSVREITWGELEAEVGAFAAALRVRGIGPGDRVVGYLPNASETLVAQLATVSIGAIWAVCGLDYPAPAALSRLAQLEPRVLVTTTRQTLAGQKKDRTADVLGLIEGLETLEFAITVAAPSAAPAPSNSSSQGSPASQTSPVEMIAYSDWVSEAAALDPLPVPFDHPLWVLFSSGTTGTPKGIVHGHGGVTLEYLKASLALGLEPGERLFWYTTPSWMMWNYLSSSLVSGASIVLYDGSPAYPTPEQVFAVGRLTQSTVLGMSPAYLEGLRGKGIAIERYPELRFIGITGSVFGPETHRWLREQIGDEVQLASSSGGTDIVSGFAGTAINLPSWLGELSAPALGVALDAFDADGGSVRGEVGELVVTRPMPSMPIRFWNDPDGQRYRDAYFDTYPGVWRHGDWITISERGSVTIHGRSDATLNRYGVRMGSGDIYGPVESLPDIAEALVLGIEQGDGGYWMPLFVVLAPGVSLDDALREKIRLAIREGASPRHVPDEVIETPAIPHTRTGKKLEVPLKKLFRGAEASSVADADAVDSPEALAWFIDYSQTRKGGQA